MSRLLPALLLFACVDPTEVETPEAAVDDARPNDASPDAAADEGPAPDARPDRALDAAPPDEVPPSLDFVEPSEGAQVAGVVRIELSAEDAGGVAWVALSVEGEALGRAEAPPYVFEWDTGALPHGDWWLEATAEDAAGNRSSLRVTVSVGECGEACPPGLEVLPMESICGNALLRTESTGAVEARFGGEALEAHTWLPRAFLLDTTELEDGPHTLEFIARDEAGGARALHTYEVDNTGCPEPPTLAFVAPAAMARVPGTVAVEVSAERAAGATHLAVDGLSAGALEGALELLDGPHTLEALIWGPRGQIGEAMVEFVVDGTPPALRVLAPPVETPLHDEATLRLETSEDTARVELRLGEAEWTLLTAPWEQILPLEALAAGVHPLELVATDGVGNETRLEHPLTVDRPPTVAFTAPEADTIVRGPIELRVEASDDLAVTEVLLQVDGVEVGPFVAGAIEWTPEYRAGPRVLTALARDAFDQTSTAELTVEVNHPLEISAQLCEEACGEIPEEVSGTITLQAEVRDDDPPPDLVLLALGGAQARLRQPPYRLEVDTTTVGDGEQDFVISVAGARGIVERRVPVTVNNCDRDHDGFNAEACGGGDCDDEREDINPGEADLEADEVDQNCDGVDGVPPDAGADAGVAPDGGLAPQTEWGPVARTVELSFPESPEAARAAGCQVVGSTAGTALRAAFDRLGGAEINDFIAPDETGRAQAILLTRVVPWLAGQEAAELGTADIQLLEGVRQERRTLIRRSDLSDPQDPEAPATRQAAEVAIDAEGDFLTPPLTFLLPFPVGADHLLAAELQGAQISGRLAIDGVGIAVQGGRVEGYWTRAGMERWTADLLALCASPGSPQPLCTLLGFALQDPAQGPDFLEDELGGFDVLYEDDAPVACQGEDCNAVGVCFLFEARGGIAHGVEGEPELACEVACDHVADCATFFGACPARSARERVAVRGACLSECTQDESLAVDVRAVAECPLKIAAFTERRVDFVCD